MLLRSERVWDKFIKLLFADEIQNITNLIKKPVPLDATRAVLRNLFHENIPDHKLVVELSIFIL